MTSHAPESTVRNLLNVAREWLTRRGVSSPRLDAELLLAHVLGMERMGLYLAPDRPLEPQETDRFRELLRRRGQGESVAYLLGSQEFWGIPLAVDARVLVPRPETELLVEQVLASVPDRTMPLRIVDVGTGSGALAIALARELPGATLVGTDVSAEALEVARSNVERHGLSERVHLMQGDLLDRLIRRGSVADILVSNPPYVARDSPDLAADVRHHEPHVALFADDGGLAVIRRLLDEARRVLRPGGLLVMEHGHDQGPAVRELAGSGYAHLTTLRDYGGHDRALLAVRDGESEAPAWHLEPVGMRDRPRAPAARGGDAGEAAAEEPSARADDGDAAADPMDDPMAEAVRAAEARLRAALEELGASSVDELDEHQMRRLETRLSDLPEIDLHAEDR